jgi:hypothetical protein
MEKFKYLGRTLTNQNCPHEEIKSRGNAVNSCYHLAWNLLSSNILSKNLKNKTQKYSFICCFVWVWNLVFHTKGRK